MIHQSRFARSVDQHHKDLDDKVSATTIRIIILNRKQYPRNMVKAAVRIYREVKDYRKSTG